MKIFNTLRQKFQKKQAEKQVEQPAYVTIQYFNSERRICEKDISLSTYKALAAYPPEYSEAVNRYIENEA